MELKTYAQTNTGGLKKLIQSPIELKQDENDETLKKLKIELEKAYNLRADANDENIKNIFQNEVLKNAIYFQKGALYEDISGIVKTQNEHEDEIEIDTKSLNLYLDFTSKKIFNKPNALVCVQLRTEFGCNTCETLGFIFLDEIKKKFINHNFTVRSGPSIITPLYQNSQLKQDLAFQEYLSKILSEKLDSSVELPQCEIAFYTEIISVGAGKEITRPIHVYSFLEFKNTQNKTLKTKFKTIIEPDQKSAFKSTPQLASQIAEHQAIGLFTFDRPSENNLIKSNEPFKQDNVERKTITLENITKPEQVMFFKLAMNELYPNIPISEYIIQKNKQTFIVYTTESIETLVTKAISSPQFLNRKLNIEISASNSKEANLKIKDIKE
jgi:hypothetical protein